MKSRILFRVNADSSSGMGHLYRCIALAEKIKNELDPVFFIESPSTTVKKIISDNSFEIIPLSNNKDFLSHLDSNKTVVIDGYHFDSTYHSEIRAKCKRLICIEDYPRLKYYASDAIINPTPFSDPIVFNTKAETRFFFGTEYALLRSDFIDLSKPNGNRSDILISIGGSDPKNLTHKITRILALKVSSQILNVVITELYSPENLSELRVLKKKYPERINICSNLTSHEMCRLMDKCRLGVFPSSSILWEALKRDVFVCFGFFAQNQISNYKKLVELNAGLPLKRFGQKNISAISSFIDNPYRNHKFNSNISTALPKLKAYILSGYKG